MNDAPYRLRPLRAVIMSLLWPWAMGAGLANGAEPPPKVLAEQAVDADGDGLKDAWELMHFRDLSAGPDGDPDGDTLGNLLESEIATNPRLADSNGDGQPDWVGIPGYLYQEKWPETDENNPRDYYPRHLFDAPGASIFFHPGASVTGKNEKFFRQRLRGRLIAPATGEYEFFITGNNWCELWLGESESRFSVRRLAGLGTHSEMSTGRSQFDKFPGQRGGPVNLVAGREYYIEILHRTRSNPAHHVAVAWKTPGAEKPVFIPQEALRSWVPEDGDSDDDGIRDAWKTQHRLAVGRQAAMEDPDGDGIVNGRVHTLGGDPLAGRPVAGALSWSRWYKPPGTTASHYDIRTFSRSAAGDRVPDFRCAAPTNGMRLPSGEGQVVATIDRLHGILTAPERGLYSFWIMGKAAAELSISPDDHAFHKQPIAHMTPNSGHLVIHDGTSAVRSIPVWLEKGERRFIEGWSLGAQSSHIRWKRHQPVVWAESSLGGGVSGAWTDHDRAMVANVRGPTNYGGAYGDRILFRHVSTEGVSEAICRIDSLRALAAGAGGGLMFRSSVDPFAPFVAVTLGSDRKFGFHSRTEGLGPEKIMYCRPYSGADFRLEDSVWLRMLSDGKSCTAHYSVDGVIWKPVGTIKIALGEKIIAGPAAWGGLGSEASQVVISHVVLGGLFPDEELPASVLATAGIDPLDLDGDGLPDAWERDQGIDASSPHGDDGPNGDPDGDDFTNLDEYRLGGHPRETGGFIGYLTREMWSNVRGSQVSDLTNHPRFKEQPDLRDLVHQPDLQGGDGDYNYGQRLRGTITAPVTGTYRFWIAGDNGCSLWLSTDAGRIGLREIASLAGAGGESTGVHEWEKFPRQRSAEIELEAGAEYHIEILHKEGSGADHVAVAWEYRTADGRAQTREILPSRVLKSYVADQNDEDEDRLPDEWEVSHGLDPRDNGRHDPQREGADGDFDGDSLTNWEEFHRGTNPAKTDTDGDGVSDAEELRVYGSDPLVKDVSPPVEYHRFQLTSGTPHVGGPWVLDSTGKLTSSRRRGSVAFEFNLEAPGVHALILEASASGCLDHVPAVPVTVSINSTILGHADFPSHGLKRTWLTPWLPAGRHTVLVDNRNVRANVNLRIHSLTLSRFEGGDTRSALPEWLAKLLASQNLTDSSDTTSTVSPCFIEGSCRLPQSVTIRKDDEDIQASDNLAGRWHANIPLSPDGAATGVQIRHENGAITHDHSIQWVETNLVTAPASNHLRVGDSIRVTAWHQPDSTFSLRLGKRVWEKQPASAPITLTFDEAGTYTLHATTADGTTTATIYQVHRADLGEPFTVIAGSSRMWTPADVRQPLEVTADDGIQLSPQGNQTEDGAALSFRIHNASKFTGPLCMVARLPGQGPIVATGSLHSLHLSSASKTGDSIVIGTLPDGTRVVEVSYIIDGPIPADLSIWVRLYVTDAVFANGLTWLQLTAADFDENGVARFNVYKAPGTGTPYVCHWILPHADFEDVLNLRPVE